jgi:hypothetical protein
MKHMLETYESQSAKTFCGLKSSQGEIVATVYKVTCLNCLRIIRIHAQNCIEREHARRPQRQLIKKKHAAEVAQLFT